MLRKSKQPTLHFDFDSTYETINDDFCVHFVCHRKDHEPLSWQFVSERGSLSSAASSSPTLCDLADRLADMRLSILVPPRAKLGCG